MQKILKLLFLKGKYGITHAARWPQGLLFLAAGTLATTWLGAAAVLLALPLVLMIFCSGPELKWRSDGPVRVRQARQRDMQTEIDRVLVATRKHPSSLACLVISIRDPAPSPDLHDRSATDRIMALCLDRLACILRPQDQIFDLMNGQIGVLVPEIAKPGHAAVLRLSDRLHTTLQAPVSFGSDTIRLSVLIGFCLEDDAPNRSGRAIYESALTALKEVGRDADSGTTARAFASPA